MGLTPYGVDVKLILKFDRTFNYGYPDIYVSPASGFVITFIGTVYIVY